MKIRPVGPSYFMRTDGQTDMTKLIVAFRNFANAPNKEINILVNKYLSTVKVCEMKESIPHVFRPS
jgi:hypothetical protein